MVSGERVYRSHNMYIAKDIYMVRSLPCFGMFSENSVSARNTSELFSCIVGISREAEIEILNKSDRWMTCSLTLHQIQASEEYIAFNLPGDTLLVEPDRGKLVKVWKYLVHLEFVRQWNEILLEISFSPHDFLRIGNNYDPKSMQLIENVQGRCQRTSNETAYIGSNPHSSIRHGHQIQ